MLRTDFLTLLPPGLGSLITDTVRTFAEKNGLKAESWVRDLPLWSVSSLDRKTGVLRQLQVGAYWINQTPELRIVPQVFRVNHGRNTLLAPERINTELIQTIQVWSLDSGERLVVALQSAWATAMKMPPREATTAIAIPLSLHYQQEL